MSKIKVALLDTEKGTVTITHIKNELQSYYDALDCRCIDIAVRRVGETYFDVICDDEGLYAEEPMFSAFDDHHEPMLVGNLIFCHHDEQGETIGITDEDEKTILSHVGIVTNGKRFWRVITGMDY